MLQNLQDRSNKFYINIWSKCRRNLWDNYIVGVDKEYKLKGLMYMQKLQEEWFDDREKARTDQKGGCKDKCRAFFM